MQLYQCIEKCKVCTKRLGKDNRKYGKILPIQYPYITLYTHHAHLQLILCAYPKAKRWIFSNYIQIYANKDYYNHRWSDYYFPMPYETKPIDACKFIKTKKLVWNHISNHYIRFIDFMINQIRRDMYIHIMINYYYIPQSEFYKKQKREHDILIYGYDLKKREFLCADFLFQDDKYTLERIAFKDLKKAFINCNAQKNGFYEKGLMFLYSFDSTFMDGLPEINILHAMVNYYQRNTPEYWTMYHGSNRGNVVIGMDVYDSIVQYLQECIIHKDIEIDIRPIYMLNSHKSMMVLRMEYLLTDGSELYYKYYQRLIDDYRELEKMMSMVLCTLLKYNFTQDIGCIKRAIDYLTRAKEYEEIALKPFVDYVLLQQFSYDENK